MLDNSSSAAGVPSSGVGGSVLLVAPVILVWHSGLSYFTSTTLLSVLTLFCFFSSSVWRVSFLPFPCTDVGKDTHLWVLQLPVSLSVLGFPLLERTLPGNLSSAYTQYQLYIFFKSYYLSIGVKYWLQPSWILYCIIYWIVFSIYIIIYRLPD